MVAFFSFVLKESIFRTRVSPRLAIIVIMNLRTVFTILLLYFGVGRVVAFSELERAEVELPRAFYVLGNQTDGFTGVKLAQESLFERQSCAVGYNQCGMSSHLGRNKADECRIYRRVLSSEFGADVLRTFLYRIAANRCMWPFPECHQH